MKRLYVGNLPWATTEGELMDYFSSYGEITFAKIVMDKESGRSRGFAFIEFAEPEDAKAALEAENGCEFNGRKLLVREAIDRRDKNAH